MVKVEMDGANVTVCETDVTAFKGQNAVEEAAIEIKGAMFSLMMQEFYLLVNQTGRSAADVGETMCHVIGCRSEEFQEFITMVTAQ